jgi:hypothetical protein
MAPVPGDSPKTPVWHVDAARGPSTPSFDHLVGELLEVQGHVEAEGLSGSDPKQCNEFPASHSITSSARASSPPPKQPTKPDG